jgi:hypothetical protein
MNRLRSGCRLAVLLALALPAFGEIYSHVDANGQRVFSDRPSGAGSAPIRIGQPNRMPAPSRLPPTQAPQREPATEQQTPYRVVEILAPAADSRITENGGQLDVSVGSEPPLQAGHQYRLRLDDAPVQQSGDSAFSLSAVDRGSHRLQVEIIDGQGRVLQRSDSRIVHLQRTSLAQRRRVQPCRMGDYGKRPECPLRDKPPAKRDIPFVPFM